MSIVSCQIGQCGNQLGQSLYNKFMTESLNSDEDHITATLETYFHLRSSESLLTPNSIMVDMEPKVIDSLLATPPDAYHSYDKKLSICREEGSGNNWAYGFLVHGVECLELIMDRFKTLTERLDSIEGVLVLQSLAGGTGSGVGSRVLEKLRDDLGTKPIYSVSVLPRLSGEVILQFYNAVFSIANLYNVR